MSINPPNFANMDSLEIRQYMADLGFVSRDDMSYFGWGIDNNGHKLIGYGIWFKHWRWHGTRSSDVTFHEHVSPEDLNQYQIIEAVRRCAKRAIDAWNNCPNFVPRQMPDGSMAVDEIATKYAFPNYAKEQ